MVNEIQLGEVQMKPPCIYLQCGKSENLLYQPTKHFTSINQRVKEAHDIIKKVKKKQRLPFIFYRKWCGKKFAQNIRLHTSSIAKSISPKYVRYYELFRGWNCFDIMVLSLFRMMSLSLTLTLRSHCCQRDVLCIL